MKKKTKEIDYSVSNSGKVTKVKNVYKDGKFVKNVTKSYDPNTKGKNVERSRVVGDKLISFGRVVQKEKGDKNKITSFAIMSPEKSKSIFLKNENGNKEVFVTKSNNKNSTSITKQKSNSGVKYSVKGVSPKMSVKDSTNKKYATQLYKANKKFK